MRKTVPSSTEEITRRRKGDPSRHQLIYCDESGTHGGRFFGFGTLWMTWERRGDFQRIWARLHADLRAPSEVKWTKVSRQTLPFFEALVDEFFARSWVTFHCIVIARSDVDLNHHSQDWDLARRKHFTMLLANKIERFAVSGRKYRIRVDPIASRYAKADEAAKVILEHTLNRVPSLRGRDTIHSLLTVDSKETPGIQLSDLLLGAVMASRQGKVTAAPKRQLIARIAEHLGWDNLTYDTYPGARKFNIWRFWDPSCGSERPEITRLATRVR